MASKQSFLVVLFSASSRNLIPKNKIKKIRFRFSEKISESERDEYKIFLCSAQSQLSYRGTFLSCALCLSGKFGFREGFFLIFWLGNFNWFRRFLSLFARRGFEFGCSEMILGSDCENFSSFEYTHKHTHTRILYIIFSLSLCFFFFKAKVSVFKRDSQSKVSDFFSFCCFL